MSAPTLSAPSVTPANTPVYRQGLALAIIVTCQLMLILDATVMNVALPRIQDGLHFSATGLSWVMTSYTLAFGGLLLLGGRAGDIFGRRKVFIAGVALFTAASLLGGFADSAEWLIAARVLQGVGAAAAGPSTIALITTTVTEPRERIKALALLSAVASGGFAIGLILGGLLTELASWRWVLFINVPFGLAAVFLAPRYVREPQQHPAKMDLPGAITATLGVSTLVYALSRAASNGWSDGLTQLLLGAGIAFIGLFLVIEMRSAQPLLPLRLFKDRNRAAGYANFLIGPAAMMSMFFFLTQFLQDVRGFSALATGFAFLPLAAMIFAVTRVIPRLLARFGPRPLAISGAVFMVSGLAWLTQLSADSGYWTSLLGPMVLMGLGGGLSFSPLTPIVMANVSPQDAGAAGGVLQTMQQTGASLGIAILVTVFGNVTRNASGSPAEILVSGMTHAFAVSAAIAACTVIIATTFRGSGRPLSRQS